MKKRIALVAASVLAMSAVTALPVRANEEVNQISAYAVDTEPADLGTTPKPAPKPKVKKPAKKKAPAKKKTTKPKAAKKTVKKPAAKKTTKKAAPKKTVKKPKKTTVKPVVQVGDQNEVSTTSEDVVSTDLKPSDDLPEASPEPKGNGAAKGLTIASVAGMSGLGLIYLLKKYFWH